MRKGICLAGGAGTRLHPLTKVCSKQLLPVYDKPMIYHPLNTLKQAGITEILIITTPHDLNAFHKLLNDGESLGLNIHYEIQNSPNGIAEAFIIGEHFIGDDDVALILGDNVFHYPDFDTILRVADHHHDDATIFAKHVPDPERYGVVEFNDRGWAKSIVEKPTKPKSNWAVTGLYFYPNDVIGIAKNMKPSDRGELEITDINKVYLEQGNLHVDTLGNDCYWNDCGAFDSLLETSNYMKGLSHSTKKTFKLDKKFWPV